MKIFYLPELPVFDARVTKVSVKPVKNFATSNQKDFLTIFRTTQKIAKLDDK